MNGLIQLPILTVEEYAKKFESLPGSTSIRTSLDMNIHLEVIRDIYSNEFSKVDTASIIKSALETAYNKARELDPERASRIEEAIRQTCDNK